MNDYNFKGSYRAKLEEITCGSEEDLRVKLNVDLGFVLYYGERFRLEGIAVNDPVAAGEYLHGILPREGRWPLRIETRMDSQGYCATIYLWQSDNLGAQEVCVNDLLVKEGFAVYKTDSSAYN